MAIVEYLDETKGPPYLLPRDDPHKRQQVIILNITHSLTHQYIDAGSSCIAMCGLWNSATSGIVYDCAVELSVYYNA